MKKLINLAFLDAAAWIMSAGHTSCQVQPDPEGYSISTPCAINPAARTTSPSALASPGRTPTGAARRGEAQETLTAARETCIQSLDSFDVSKMALA